MIGTRGIDLSGIYDPWRPNERLLLGMKVSISVFELGILDAGMLIAERADNQLGNRACARLWATPDTPSPAWASIRTCSCRK